MHDRPEFAAIDCRLHAVHDGGDHSILVGRVEHSGVSDRPPLVYHGGRYGTTHGL